MPNIPSIQIGNITRPDIYLQEYDNSVISPAPSVTGTTPLVIGVSKTGPINTPVLFQSTTDFTNAFGDIDRNLERRGSFFHRTVQNLLASGPVYAMNLLATSDVLDQIQYKTVSTRSDYTNDVERTGPLRKFYNTTGFWQLDSDNFTTLVNNDPGSTNRLLAFTNVSSSPITVFVVKSSLTGYDVSMITWYGTIDQVPPYLNPLDYASDYLVDVLVVSGDWSNYVNLSVDPNWSSYFNTSGLIKTQILNFANNRNVNTLKYYQGLSLIPYFQDNSGKNIFIETNINNDTQNTGLFCAYDMDKFETNYPSGMVDLIGNNLINTDVLLGSTQSSINYLSYNTSIVQSLPYAATPLDSTLNGQSVVALGPSVSVVRDSWGGSNRTAFYSESYVNGLIYASASSNLTGTSSLLVGYTSFNPSLGTTSSMPYYVVGGNEILVNGGTLSTFTFSVSANSYPITNTISNYTSVYYLDTVGNVSTANSTTPGVAPSVDVNATVLGYLNFNTFNGQILQAGATTASASYAFTFTGTASNGQTAYLYLNSPFTTIVPTYSFGGTLSHASASVAFYGYLNSNAAFISTGIGITQSGSTITLSAPSIYGSQLNGTIVGVTGSFNQVSGTWSGGSYGPNYGVIYTPLSVKFTGFGEYVLGTDFTVTDLGAGSIQVVFLGTANVDVASNYISHRRIKLFNHLLGMLDSANLYKMTMLSNITTRTKLSLANASVNTIVTSTTQNKSFILNLGVTTTPADIAAGNIIFYNLDNEIVLGTNTLTTMSTQGTASNGVVAKYSTLYQDFYNGIIETGDYFYHNISDTTVRTVLQNNAGNGYIVFSQTPWVGSTSWGFDFIGNETIILPESTLNTSTLTLAGSTNYINTLTDPATGASYSVGYVAYELTAQVVAEIISTVTTIYDTESPVYLQMSTDINANLSVVFVANDLASPSPIDVTYDNPFSVISFLSNYQQTVEIVTPVGYTASNNKILVNAARYATVKAGDFLEAYVDTSMLEVGQMPRKLTRVVSKKIYAANTSLAEITCDSAIEKYTFNGGTSYQTNRYAGLDAYVTTYQGIVLDGFTIRAASLPDGTEATQTNILNLVSQGTPLFNALTNKNGIDFRYLVDSFGLGLIPNSKQQLNDIVGTRLDAIAFLNMPSLKYFSTSSSPSFVDENGVLQTSYIASGGNLDAGPAFLYSFAQPTTTTTVTRSMYLLPYVTVNDNGRPISVPPAAYVAATFLTKYNSGVSGVTPWTVSAGTTNGRVQGIAGIESNFTPQDISNLNLAHMNPIIYIKNRGFIIDTENTALTLYKSAESYVHCIEVLIELERELRAMLIDFKWTYNTVDTRASIKRKADVICGKYVSQNGLYSYTNICDTTNNTPELIDNQIGVLYTSVTPVKAMAAIVNQVVILPTGSVQSTGFTQQ